MQTQTLIVTGMTCQHCVASVTEEVSELDGVTGVEVDLDTGTLRVTGEGVPTEQVQAAVRAAGEYSADPA